jgi:hypothetical protein
MMKAKFGWMIKRKRALQKFRGKNRCRDFRLRPNDYGRILGLLQGEQRPILNFTPGPQGITSPLGLSLAPRVELGPQG